MRVHWLQHAEHEGLGCIEPWLHARGHAVTHTRLYAGDLLPRADAFDWLVVMGGPMNVHEHDRHPWLVPEKALIRDACVNNKRVLGICLGAQLAADVLGGPVTRNPCEEIGWFDVMLNAHGRKSAFFQVFPERFAAFHWHGDTFAIPPGAENLMSSEACRNQAFAWAGRVVGIQYHLEVTEADARRWLQTEALRPQRHVQDGAEILREPARFALNNALMVKLLERIETLS